MDNKGLSILLMYNSLIEHYLCNYYCTKWHLPSVKDYDNSPLREIIAYSNSHTCAVLTWCKLFGKDNEQTHWKQLLKQQDIKYYLSDMEIGTDDQLKDRLLMNCHQTDRNFKVIWSAFIHDRDKLLAHKDIDISLSQIPEDLITIEDFKNFLHLVDYKSDLELGIQFVEALYYIIYEIINKMKSDGIDSKFFRVFKHPGDIKDDFKELVYQS